MSQPAPTIAAPPSPAAPALQLVRLPVDKPHAAVAFLRTRSQGVMDLIAHFWESLAQTAPLQRGDLHLVAALEESNNKDININTLDAAHLAGAMLYVPKAHRADILAPSPPAAAALAAYICHQGSKIAVSPVVAGPDVPANTGRPVEWGEPIATFALTDLTARQPASELIAAELPARPGNGAGTNGSHTSAGTSAGGSGSGGAGNIPIDFLSGEASGIDWITALLLPVVHKRVPARQLINVVMQLPADVSTALDPQVRLARESDIPVLNRWRRLYKEERGIHFDADMDALIHHQRVFVYELPSMDASPAAGGASEPDAGAGGGIGSGSSGGTGNAVAAVAKIDLDLKDLVEVGGVYTFPEHRHHGYGATLMRDMAHRIRQAGKMPTLQVDESNTPALRLYEKMGWRSMGRLARVWLTG